MQQQVPRAQVGVAPDSSTNDASDVPPQSLSQHNQPVQQQTIPQQQQHLPVPLPTPASRPVSTHNSEEQLQSTAPQAQPQPQHTVPVTAAKASVPKPSETALKLATSAMQAQDVLARALAQANPAMVQAISQGQQGPLKQGLLRYTPSTVTAAAAQVAKVDLATQQAAPGPATAALDEALRAQSAHRSQSRSNLLLTEQHPHKEPSKSDEKPAPKDSNEAQTPLPYAPSISMIAARLKGYQKSNAAAAAAREEAQTAAAHQESPQERLPINPLPAVPNPLLGILSECESNAPVKLEDEQEHPPPAHVVAARHQEQDSDGGNSNHNSNSMSSVTMSACPSFVEENGSDTTLNNTTDTDSDRAVTSSFSNPEAEDNTASITNVPTATEAPMDIEGEAPANAEQKNADSTNKNIIVG
eukprot:CAMPEP_0197274970 /NCGR_PEP_ID=MMETSP1432-20130617/13347_1 /TAXON_ID=44447 /ORGANISM="Pseudo-nitzschia delicatissima, Strain UNC1205" /LENGTH=413 /DNA_ID=CAMNT_0042740833 /DNA_START=12 /DNA_END=1253 /DNA_ORIENTATION=+